MPVLGACGLSRPAQVAQVLDAIVEVCVREPETGCVLLVALMLRSTAERILGVMKPHPPLTGASKDARGPKKNTASLITDWQRYLRTQQAYSDIHVRKSGDAATTWCAWAKEHGWDTTSGMRWSQALIEKTSRKTAQNKVSQAREFCRYLILTQAITANPLEGVRIANGRRDRRRQWAPFEVSEVRKLIDAAEARESSTDRRRSKGGPLASTFYALLTLTGLRYTEARNQLWADIDLVRASMVVTADKAKRQDCLPLCTEAVSVLKAWRKWSTGERLFPQVPSAHTLRGDMKAAGIKAAADGGEKGEWHRFRKTAIAERAAGGADVRNLHHFARHDNVQTTLAVYDRAKVDQLRSVAALMPRLNGFLKREMAGVSLMPEAASGKKSGDTALTFGPHRAEDVTAEFSKIAPPQAPAQHDESGPWLGATRTQHPSGKPPGGRPRSAVQVIAGNGAVGNCTPGSKLSGDQIDRLLGILEHLLGVRAGGEGHDDCFEDPRHR